MVPGLIVKKNQCIHWSVYHFQIICGFCRTWFSFTQVRKCAYCKDRFNIWSPEFFGQYRDCIDKFSSKTSKNDYRVYINSIHLLDNCHYLFEIQCCSGVDLCGGVHPGIINPGIFGNKPKLLKSASSNVDSNGSNTVYITAPVMII